MIFDTCILIAHEDDLPGLKALAQRYPLPAVAAITVAELGVGVAASVGASQRLRRTELLRCVKETFRVIPISEKVESVHHALQEQVLSKGGQGLAYANDLIIAATAIAHGHAVLTRNVKDFRNIPGVEVEEP